MEKTLQTIIVLRNDKSTDWASSEVILREGEVGVSYLDNGNVVVKAGDGVNKWPQLKQVEGVFEQPVTLTQNFGYYNDVPSGGYKTYADTVGMTTSEFLLSALKKTVEPTITQPSASLSATPSGSTIYYNTTAKQYYGEIGDKITKLNWDGSSSNGSYKVGSGTVQSSGISSSDFTWAVSNNNDSQTATTVDGTFTFTSDDYIQINTDGSANYATVSATVTLDPSKAKTPKNNLNEDTSGKIIGFDTNGTTTKNLTANVAVTGYRKPFWGVIAAADGLKSPVDYTSADVRALPDSATTATGLPGAMVVPVGSQMVVFFVQAGKYSSLVATDDKAMNAEVSFTKVANACSVEGANGFTGTNYDLWYVDWQAGIDTAKQLTLEWS
jgi:hypothetical protein